MCGERSAATPRPQFIFNSDERCRSNSSGSQTVTVMQATKSWHGHDPATYIRVLLCFTTRRCSLCQREMRSVVVIVADVLVHQAFQMPFIENDHMVEQIAAAVANPALGNAVLPWTSETGPLWLECQSSSPCR